MIDSASKNIEAKTFLNAFIQYSRNQRQPYEPEWQLGIENYLVVPPNTLDTTNPFHILPSLKSKQLKPQEQILIDPETNVMVDTLVAQMGITLFGQRDFIKAKRTGAQNTEKAVETTKLLKYALRLDPVYFESIAALKDSIVYGTGILEGYWCYEEGSKTYRNYGMGGVMDSMELNEPSYDDVKFERVDLRDFFPDPDKDCISKMMGCARRIRMTVGQARSYANKGGTYGFNPSAVEEAAKVATAGIGSDEHSDKSYRPEHPEPLNVPPMFKQMRGYRYYGLVPFESGEEWRVLTILNGVIVQNDSWFMGERIIPFFDMRPCFIGGRFWGLSKPVAMRYLQDAASFALTMTKEMTLRMVKPPLVYNINDRFDLSRLKAWTPDQPIGLSHPEQLHTLQYNPNLQAGFELMNILTGKIQSGSGALAALQGLGIGVNRASGTEASNTFAAAGVRPELMSKNIEENCLPRMAGWTISMYQNYLVDDQELIERIGPVDSPIPLAEIDGDHDVEFVGSRKVANAEKRMRFAPQIVSLSQSPQASRINWDSFYSQLFEDAGWEDIEIGNPATIQQNIAIAQQAGSPPPEMGNGANAPVGPSPSVSPAEAAGGPVIPGMGA